MIPELFILLMLLSRNGKGFQSTENHDSLYGQIGTALLAESGGRDLKAAGCGVGVVRGEVAADKLSGQQTE